MRYSLLALTAVFAGVLISCRPAPKRAVEAPPAAQPDLTPPLPRTRGADDVGRFLAGMPGSEGSPFKPLESQEAWKLHSGDLDRAWGKLETVWLPAVRKFQKSELSSPAIATSVIFYPFSGPDALAVTTFFPRNRTHVLVGLEPAGTLPALKQLEKQDLDVELAEVRETLASVLHRSFFITRQMDHQFRGQITDGLLPAILELLVRTRHTVLGFRYVRLDDRGQIIERAAGYKAPGRIGNKGVEIDFRTDADRSVHKLFYFSVNLADDRLRGNKPFLLFLSRLNGVTTFFKATSYMTHHPEFSLIRGQILEKSGVVLQDDSGIPYRFFDAARWRVQLYGQYDRPYGSFRWLEQPDLKKAYQTGAAKELEFHIGYGFSRIPSNLLLAERRRR